MQQRPQYRKLAKHKHARMESEFTQHRKVKRYRIFSFVLFLGLLPILVPLHLGLILVYKALNEASFPLLRSYVKLYFRCFFYFSGVENLDVFPIKEVKKPCIIFTVRNTPLTSAYLLTRFKEPVVLPYQKKLSLFPLNLFFPFLRLGAFVHSLGYEDLPLKDSLETIHKALKQNKAVVVYLNHDVVNYRHDDSITLHKRFYDLLQLSVPCYFVRCKNLEMYNLGAINDKRFVTMHFHEKDDLLENIPNNINDYARRIKDFYDFKVIKAHD